MKSGHITPPQCEDLFIAFRLDLVVLQMFSTFLAQLPVSTPAQQEECRHDQDPAYDGCEGERLACAEPVDDCDEEDCQKRGNG